MDRIPVLEYALIGLLKQKPQSGYDLRKQFTTTPMRHFSDSPGSIYPALKRLQTRRWVAVAREEEGRKRQVFRVTKEGEREFIRWLEEGVMREDVIWRMEEVLIRFAFQGGNVPKAVTLKFLAQLESELDAYIRELRAFSRQAGFESDPSTGGLAFHCGIHGYEAQLGWTKSAQKKLMERKS